MPIKVFFPQKGDPYIETDSPQEALALMKLRSNGHETQQPLRFPREGTGSAGDVFEFLRTINQNAQKLLLALVKHEKGVRGEQFSEETGVASEKFGGILGGASKIAKKNGLKIEQFVHSEMIVKGTDRYRFLRPGKLLLENVDKLQGKAQ
jgi:hypothetical protein